MVKFNSHSNVDCDRLECSRFVPVRGENATDAERDVLQVGNRNDAMKILQYQVLGSDWIRGVFRKQGHVGSCLFIILYTHTLGREYRFGAKWGGVLLGCVGLRC